MRALMIGPKEKAAIAALIKKADANRIGYDSLRAAAAVYEPVPIMHELKLVLPTSFSVCYTVEEQEPRWWFKHLTVAVDGGVGMSPNMHAVEMIMSEFGFVSALNNVKIWVENLPDGTAAPHILEPLNGVWKRPVGH